MTTTLARKHALLAAIARVAEPFAGVVAHDPVDQTPLAWAPAPDCENR